MHRESQPFDGDDELIGALRHAEAWTLAQRHLVCVGSFEDEIAVKGGRAFIGPYSHKELKLPTTVIPTREGVEDQSGRGRVELFISPLLRYTAIAITLHGKLIVDWFLSDVQEATRREFIQYSFDSGAVSKLYDSLRKVLTSTLDGFGWDPLLTEYRNDVQSASDALYREWAMMFTPDQKLDKAAQMLTERGIYSVLNRSLPDLEALAALSIGAGLNPSKEVLSQFLEKRGHVLQELVKRCLRFSADTGVPLIHDMDSMVLSYI